ncbi:unnamed protein product [Linum tenue]|uniref:Uncharacterized protein n=1 Tax=Linum tenue TaxID=586396 RepID=A0AAV0INX9_9ROSI|nr:unnamed protein product [Linum tenue]
MMMMIYSKPCRSTLTFMIAGLSLDDLSISPLTSLQTSNGEAATSC